MYIYRLYHVVGIPLTLGWLVWSNMNCLTICDTAFTYEIQSIVCMLYHMKKSKTNVQPKNTISYFGINPYTMSYHVILGNTVCSFVSTAIIPVCVCKAYMSFMLTLARVTWKEWKGQNKPTYKRSGLNIFCNIWISLQKTNDINIW